MSKFSKFFSKSIDKVKKFRTNDWPDERVNKWAKIASFFTGFIFNLLGIIAVAVWKYIFCNNENKSKYCVRIAILGMIAEVVLFAKFFAFSTFWPRFGDNFFGTYNGVRYKQPIKPIFIDDIFDGEMERMNKVFEASRREFDKAMKAQEEEFNKMIAEQAQMAQVAKDGKNVEVSKDGKVVKKVENKNKRYKETTIEKTPGGFKKVVKEEYHG